MEAPACYRQPSTEEPQEEMLPLVGGMLGVSYGVVMCSVRAIVCAWQLARFALYLVVAQNNLSRQLSAYSSR